MTLYKFKCKSKNDVVYVYAETPEDAIRTLKQYDYKTYDDFSSMEILEKFTNKILIQTD